VEHPWSTWLRFDRGKMGGESRGKRSEKMPIFSGSRLEHLLMGRGAVLAASVEVALG